MFQFSKLQFFVPLHTRLWYVPAFLVCVACPSSSNTDESQTTVVSSAGQSSAPCSTNPPCQLKCKTIFETSKQLYDKCLKETSADVTELNKAISAMEKGRYSSIKAESLKVLVDFDEDIWPKYAGVKNKDTVKAMLLWVAESEDISAHLYPEVLKRAFTVLGMSKGEDLAIQEGIKQQIDPKTKRNFFEVSVFKNNKKAFEEGHALLMEECSKDSFCVKKFYCTLNEPLVFGKLNTYGMAQDIQKSGSFYKSDCD